VARAAARALREVAALWSAVLRRAAAHTPALVRRPAWSEAVVRRATAHTPAVGHRFRSVGRTEAGAAVRRPWVEARAGWAGMRRGERNLEGRQAEALMAEALMAAHRGRAAHGIRVVPGVRAVLGEPAMVAIP